MALFSESDAYYTRRGGYLLDYLRRSVSGQFEMKSIVGGTGLNSELPLQ